MMNRLAPALSTRLLLALSRLLSGLQDKTVVAAEIPMVYSEGGRGETLILLHGLGADRSTFSAVAAFLRRDSHLIIPDLPGFGESGQAPDGDYGITAQVERLEAFVVALGLSDFHLGGNSMGGWIAASYTARYPGRVKSLWLLAAAGTEDMLATEAVIARRAQGSYLLLASNDKEFAAVIGRIFVRPPPLPFCVRWVGSRRAASYFPLHAKIFDQLLDRGYDYQLEPVLPAITQPVLLMWGDQDRIVPLSVMQTFARLLPHARSVLLPNIGHVPQIEAPKRAADNYRAFRTAVV
jgi:triacylglycerol lipase